MGPSAWGSPGAGGTEPGGSGGQSGHCRTRCGTEWLFLRRRAGAGLRCQRFRGQAWSPAGLAVTGVAAGQDIDVPGRGGDTDGTFGHGRVWDEEKCWAAPNAGERCRGAAGARCPQSRVPKATSCPRCVQGKLGTPFGSLFPPSSEGCGVCAPSQTLGCHPKGVPHISGGSWGVPMEGAGAGGSCSLPLAAVGRVFHARCLWSRRRKWLIVSPAGKNRGPKNGPNEASFYLRVCTGKTGNGILLLF